MPAFVPPPVSGAVYDVLWELLLEDEASSSIEELESLRRRSKLNLLVLSEVDGIEGPSSSQSECL